MFMNRTVRLLVVLMFLLTSGCLGRGVEHSPSAQPLRGPGAAEYAHADVAVSIYHEDTDTEFRLFEPASPTPETAPLIVFNHGWNATNPNSYGAWIRHLARRGNIVVYPRYQASAKTPMQSFTPNAVGAVEAALAELMQGKHVRPELNRFAIVGHSMGAAVAANMAALTVAEGLPGVRAVMCVEPGSYVVGKPDIAMPLADFSKIPASALVLVVVGDQDSLVGDRDARRIFAGIKHIPARNKNLVTLVSDSSHEPALIADHQSPAAFAELVPQKERRLGGRLRERIKDKKGIGRVDALDYYGYWKLFDGLTDAAFYGKNREYALGNTREQRYMGRWPDGTPVRELMIIE